MDTELRVDNEMRSAKFCQSLALVFLTTATAALGADWDQVRRISEGQQIEVTTRNGIRARGAFVLASTDSVVVREQTGEHSVARSDINRVRIYDPARRVRRGIMWTIIGGGLGAGLGVAACPGCGNEGTVSPYIGPGAAGGAAIGALGFLTNSYRTIYRDK